MIIELDKTGTIKGFDEIVQRVTEHKEVKGLMILSCDKNGFTPNSINNILVDIPIPIFGGNFPAIIHNNKVLEKGTVIAGLLSKPDVQVIPGLSSDVPDFDDLIDEKYHESDGSETMFVIVDGMATRVNTLLESLFNVFGLEINYIGGGAGSLSFKRKPCIFTNQGLIQDCAVLALVDIACGIGVNHGLESVAGPFKITEAKGNTIYSLNWEPAYLFFQKIINNHPVYGPNNFDFKEIKGRFSLALNRYNAEKVILEPIGVGENNSLMFLPEINEGEFVDIVRATVESSIKSAAKALNNAQSAYKNPSSVNIVITFDCIARKRLLGDLFNEEVNSIYTSELPLIGALSFGGEIANNGIDYLDYYSRTCVVGIFEKM